MLRTFFIMLLLLPALAEARPPIALVEIDLTVPGSEVRLREMAGRLDILEVVPGSHARIAADPRELEILRGAGLSPRILEEDLEARVIYPDKGAGFGIFHTRSESIAWLDSLRLLYPEVISEKWSIGTSVEGRDIWAFRVSDNPDLDEAEPEILIDGMHHAREIMASEFPLMFAEYLAQNYGSDPDITWLLDNRELYVVPIINPDGFVYNETIEPDGGGMWRKNRRDNGDGSFGVDPNRNYPYEWGYNDTGSSDIPASLIYRGPHPGSEPEVQAMMNLINGREFRTHATVHSTGNVIAYPWGYDDIPAPDEPALAALAEEMALFTEYRAMSSYDFYPANGTAKDWSYGAQDEHETIFCYLIEIGRNGFWPPEELRGPQFRETLQPCLKLMRAAGVYLTLDNPVTMADPAKDVAPGEAGLLTFSVRNHAVAKTSTSLTATLTSDDPWIQLGATQFSISPVAPLTADDQAMSPVPFTVDPACPAGHRVAVTVSVHLPLGDLVQTLAFAVAGREPIVFTDGFESGTGNWILDPPWYRVGLDRHSGYFSLSDSPYDYPRDQFVAATLTGARRATELNFWHYYAFDENWYPPYMALGLVQVSVDNGEWTTLKSYTGFQSSWTEETINLDPYYGHDIEIRFVTDTHENSVIQDGWHLDDITVYGFPANQTPPVPVADPLSGSPPTYDLHIATGPDPQGSPVVCGFKVFGDAESTQVLAEVADLPTTDNAASWTPPALPNGTYWWRAWAGDGVDRSNLMPAAAFTVDDISSTSIVLPDGPTLQVLGTGAGRARMLVGVPASGDVKVAIYDARGARVRDLHHGFLEGGTRTLVWDGRDQHGRTAASGVYFVRAIVAGSLLTGRMVLVR